jgi:hypothetical protein
MFRPFSNPKPLASPIGSPPASPIPKIPPFKAKIPMNFGGIVGLKPGLQKVREKLKSQKGRNLEIPSSERARTMTQTWRTKDTSNRKETSRSGTTRRGNRSE